MYVRTYLRALEVCVWASAGSKAGRYLLSPHGQHSGTAGATVKLTTVARYLACKGRGYATGLVQHMFLHAYWVNQPRLCTN